ncbi:MAG: hypothetical protein OHK0029_25430 [Armatimonadaceae bacterium]
MNCRSKLASVAAILFGSIAAALPLPAAAQENTATRDTNAPPAVSLDVRDAPLRTALEQLFEKAKVDFVLDPRVAGFVTLRLTDQPFENALKLLLRSGAVPLSYRVENGVYIVEPRTVEPSSRTVSLTPPPAPATLETPSRIPLETIQLVHIDPFDLAPLFNLTLVPTGSRFDGFFGGNSAGNRNAGNGAIGNGGNNGGAASGANAGGGVTGLANGNTIIVIP